MSANELYQVMQGPPLSPIRCLSDDELDEQDVSETQQDGSDTTRRRGNVHGHGHEHDATDDADMRNGGGSHANENEAMGTSQDDEILRLRESPSSPTAAQRARGRQQQTPNNPQQNDDHPFRRRTSRFSKFKQRIGWDPTPEEIIQEHGRRFHHASEMLLERLFRYLSQLPEEDMDDSMDDISDSDSDRLRASHFSPSRPSPSVANGITLPASAVAWLSSQLYPPEPLLRRESTIESDENEIESNADDDDEHDGVMIVPEENHQQRQSHHQHGRQVSPLWMGIHMRDRLALLKFLLPRATHVRIAGNMAWPPPLDDATLKQHIRRQRQIRQRQEQRQNRQNAMIGQDLNCSHISVNSALTMESQSFMGQNGSPSHIPSLQAVQDYFYQLQHQPMIDLRLFPKLQVLVLEQIPANWIRNLSSISPTLHVIRMDKGCIYDLNHMLCGSNDEQAYGDTIYPHVTHMKLSKCDINAMSGMRSDITFRSTNANAQRQRRRLPPLARFPNLQVLSLSHNHLSDEKDALTGLAQCTYLQRFDLSYNNLTSLPKIHMNLGNIATLNLSYNQLTTVQGIDRLYSLKNLDLYQNQLASIGAVASLARLPELVSLNLKGNPLINTASAASATTITTSTTAATGEGSRTNRESRNNDRRQNASSSNSKSKNNNENSKSHRLEMWILFAQQRFDSPNFTYEQCKHTLPKIDNKLPNRSDVQKLQQEHFIERITIERIHQVIMTNRTTDKHATRTSLRQSMQSSKRLRGRQRSRMATIHAADSRNADGPTQSINSNKRTGAVAKSAAAKPQKVILSTRRSASFTVKDVLRLSMPTPVIAPKVMAIPNDTFPDLMGSMFKEDEEDAPPQLKEAFQDIEMEAKADGGPSYNTNGRVEESIGHQETPSSSQPQTVAEKSDEDQAVMDNERCNESKKEPIHENTDDQSNAGLDNSAVADDKDASDEGLGQNISKNITDEDEIAIADEGAGTNAAKNNLSMADDNVAVEKESIHQGDGAVEKLGGVDIEKELAHKESGEAEAENETMSTVEKQQDEEPRRPETTAMTTPTRSRLQNDAVVDKSDDLEKPEELNSAKSPLTKSSDTNKNKSSPRKQQGGMASVRLYPGASQVHKYDIFSQDWDDLVEQAAQGLILNPLRNPLEPKMPRKNRNTQIFGNSADLLGDFPIVDRDPGNDKDLPARTNESQMSIGVSTSLTPSAFTSQSSALPDLVIQDDFSVPSSLGASRDDFLAFNKFQLAEDNSTYDGPSRCLGMAVAANLDLYFRSFVFPSSVPDMTQDMLDQLEESEHWQIAFLKYPRIQLWPEDRRQLGTIDEDDVEIDDDVDVDLSEILKHRERLVRLWNEAVIPCGRPATRRLLPRRSQRLGFHGDLLFSKDGADTYAEGRNVILCLSSAALYVILDHDAVTGTRDKKKRFPRPLPIGSFFKDAQWPHAVARHPLEYLKKITIGFGFQRLTLHFENPSIRSADPFTYVLLSSNKLETISILKDIQNCAKAAGDIFESASLGSGTNDLVPIENDDRNVLESLAVAIAPEVVGIVLHYQILKQRWKHGDRGKVRRVCVVTDTKIFLLDEDYHGDGSTATTGSVSGNAGRVQYKLIDEATLKQIAEVQAANADPTAMTIVINPLSRLSRTHRWRLVCRDSDGAERLVADLRKAIEMAD
mmetsp:Transcript_24741/g.69469  ORF Transcript_24741/g.69469 Transcript_24741/m.69469 type:complete len:1659 (-) Transcript_24741:174-5150(-)|eukprot:CAMPEP_0119564100 /NCGR_PEP_ID=MMETSP1352-20130426/25802_1 /TAXON_ID=265584 /ORGANISM="Stauroneis constricta, Strain CCMP1120" /LENGTH=1658 /DNA_ID=CAMNT_0007612809 /DNA_START=206 /DNA_END=5182 /DNA_ORIENTATION=-